MLYDKSKSEKPDKKLFENPGKEFRGAPFWAWNAKLDKKELLWQIDRLKDMGFGGFFMHTRCGMATEYLGREYMEMVKACDEHAKKEDMLAYLYDEDRWASGAAGGYVTENKKYRNKYLLITQETPEAVYKRGKEEDTDPVFVAAFDVVIDKNNLMTNYSRIGEYDSAVKGVKWLAYRVLEKPSGWFNGYTYIDAMCGEAVDKFIDVTYEAYKREVGGDFGKSVPAIFTDEPNYGHCGYAAFAHGTQPVLITWTDDFSDTFKAARGYNIVDRLPEVVWDLSDGPNTARYHFYDHACQRFADGFCRRIGRWCDENGIAFTGHVLNEETLDSQTRTVGEAMRHYGGFGLPGIDMLCNKVELSTAKQCQSAVHQYGREGMLSELYGVTGWDFDFKGHKFQGDWQAALGVTLRVPHLSWVSMKGSAKRDYPASIGYQSAWYKEYSLVEDHFARLNTALTRGVPSVNVGVIHPIESFWLGAGPIDVTSADRARMETQFDNVINWLLRGNIDFDFIAESTVPELYSPSEKGFQMGKMNYSVILVPPVRTLRSTTVGALTEFRARGGRVLFAGKCPDCVDGALSDGVKKLYGDSERIEFSSSDILDALAEAREVDIVNDNGARTNNLIYNMRNDGADKWLFIARCDQVGRFNGGECNAQKIILTVKGVFIPEIYDTVTGEIRPVVYRAENGRTTLNYSLNASDSLLIKLNASDKAESCLPEIKKAPREYEAIDFPSKVSYELKEPNVLVLDMCEYSWDGLNWEKKDEILRIDESIRRRLSYPYADGHDVQPWKIKESAPDKFPYLRFKFTSEVDADCVLAFEEAAEIVFNGKDVSVNPTGWYVDKDIRTVKLPAVKKGENVLVVRAPISKRISLENMFLLGNFGVRVEGREAVVTALPEKLAFGSVTDQGLPFYGAEIIYKLPFETEGGDVEISADYFNGAVISAEIDGKPAGKIAYFPYSVSVKGLSVGKHEFALTLYASRINTFGALHDATDHSWKGANIWYTRGSEWAYEYQLKPVGIMKSPQIRLIKNS